MEMQKLLNIQRDLKAPKSQYNSFGKYNYRNCEDILEAVKPLCSREGACLTISDEVVQIGERYYIKATAALYDSKTGEEINHVTAYAREEAEKKGMDGSQVTGAASSYARKYALNGLFDIDDTKDADSEDADSEDKGSQGSKSSDSGAKTAPAGKQTSGEKKGVTLEEALATRFTFAGTEYVLANLSEEWLRNNKDKERFADIKPQMEVVLKYKMLEAMNAPQPDTPFGG